VGDTLRQINRPRPGMTRPPRSHARFRRPRVLLLQPARDDREMYVLFLQCHGVTTLAASTPVQAMAMVPSVDVIVTGIGLAGMTDGLEFVRAVRRAAARHIPVIVLTAHADRNHREWAFAAGCDRFIAKPCLPEALMGEIYEVCGESPRPTADIAPTLTIVR
jgi:two-component system, cell cycle response regulator DivK